MSERIKNKWKNPILLGKGAFSEVYRVTDGATGELLVCKQSSRMKLAVREAGILTKIDHPLFPAYKGQAEYDGKHYLFMEYICGTDLKSYVQKRRRLPQKRAVEIVRTLAEGLLYLHEQSETVIFRDVKPENVMIQQDGQVRLIDLGCVYIAGDGINGMAGTKGYAAPEQFLAEGRAGMESDVYALGRLLYFMLTGQENFVGTYPKGTSPGLKQFIAQAVQEDIQLRIPDMRSFLLEVAVYEEKSALKRLFRAGKQRFGRKKERFYFKKNIIKGM